MNYYSDWFNGGHCFNGWSAAYNSGGTQQIAMPIPAGATERRTFIFMIRQGNAPNLTLTLQGQPFTFSAANQVTATFQSPTYGGNSAVHAIDITGQFNININSFLVNIPPQPGSSNRYGCFVIYRSFDRTTSPKFNAHIELNEFNLQQNSPTWSVVCPSPMRPMNTALPVAIGLMGEYICDCADDSTRVFINGTLLGTIGGHHPSFGTCGGGLGSYLYFDTTFQALLTPNGNNTNQAMACADMLSDVKAILPNGSLSFTMNFNNVTTGNNTNAVWGLILGYHDTGGAPYECSGCSNYSVTNLTSTSATLNWNGGAPPAPCFPQGTAFVNNIRYRAVGSPTWTLVTVDSQNLQLGQTANSLDISGLSTGVQYEWYVENTNNDGAICSPGDTQLFLTP